jgi:hypothetical protein
MMGYSPHLVVRSVVAVGDEKVAITSGGRDSGGESII